MQNLIATQLGVQRITGITDFNTRGTNIRPFARFGILWILTNHWLLLTGSASRLSWGIFINELSRGYGRSHQWVSIMSSRSERQAANSSSMMGAVYLPLACDG
ncbi:unnamed protein product [Prunus armeniaca]|uniref:Uncharacterized protein n=1 Tax=Prunus armeniaca TaxID=36596 RepID=A0A6J5W202_PRUAR|nr:unnamed protein product [Prunus armeniaca]